MGDASPDADDAWAALSRPGPRRKPPPDVPNRRPWFPRSTPPPGPSAHPSGFSVRSQQDSFGFNPTAHQRLPFVPPLPRSSIPGSATMIPQTCPHRLSENQCHNKLGDILCQVYTAQSRHSRFRHTPLPLAFPNQRLQPSFRYSEFHDLLKIWTSY